MITMVRYFWNIQYQVDSTHGVSGVTPHGIDIRRSGNDHWIDRLIPHCGDINRIHLKRPTEE
ncbi:hypothetical protein CHELA1G11_14420 [Hyphomicrobiales bacterium]|nr:hypothetical protein CHELA1G11_14420 [Hyphomicrobiales bacterium]